SAEWIGIISALVMSTKIIAPNLWGWLADYSGERLRVIRLGSFFAMLAFSGVFFQHSLVMLLFSVFLYSFFWNAVLAQFEVITLEHLHGQFEIYSRIRLWGSIGFIVAVIGLGYIFDLFSVALFPILLIGGLFCIWFSSLLVSEKPNGEHLQADSVEGVFALVRQPKVYLFFIICFFMQLSHGPYYTFFSLYLENHHYDSVAVGIFWAVGVLAEVLLFWFMHRLLPRWGLKCIMIVSLVLTTLRWLLIGLFPQYLSMLLLAQCLHAFSFGAFHAVAIEQVRRFFGGRLAGRGQALYSSLSFGAGSAIGALLSGYFWGAGSGVLFLLAAAVSMVATIAACFWKQEA
ncbi:MAG: MFS transporter, partial [Pseudomonadales bacterium]|nr:MFS transporter [Pseudomonadales bacterium]